MAADRAEDAAAAAMVRYRDTVERALMAGASMDAAHAAARADIAEAAAALRAAGKSEAQVRDIIAAHFHGSGK